MPSTIEAARAQLIIPYLSYVDAAKAIDFLCAAFGFEERLRYPMPDGRIGHAELAYRDNLIMLASEFEGFGTSPLKLPTVHCQIYCLVDDADAHFERARDVGATIVSEPHENHGTRMYRALDPEGHRWLFAAPLARSAS